MSTPAAVASQLRGLVPRTKFTAMSRAVLVVEAQAKREAPVKKGTLRRSITSRVEQGGNRGVIGTNLGYAVIVHEGSRPHVITPRRAKALYWRGARHPVRRVRHPGTRANRFFPRAANSSRAAVERELAAVWNNALGGIR